MSHNVLRHLCEEVDEITSSGDPRSLPVAQIAIRLAARLTQLERWCRRPAQSAELATSFARLAFALRVKNRLGHAERALAIGMELSPPEGRGDLYRRRAWLRAYQGRLGEARKDAELAVELTVGQEHALALAALGVALDYQGDHPTAACKLGMSLRKMDPNWERNYCATLVSYALVLSKGTDDDARYALKLCGKQRARFKDRHRMQRAKTWWVEGLLHGRLGDPKAAWWALDVARRSLVAMKAAPEIAAIVADMTRVSPEPLAVRHLCAEASAVIPAPHPLSDQLLVLQRAARDSIPEAATALRQAADELSRCPTL